MAGTEGRQLTLTEGGLDSEVLESPVPMLIYFESESSTPCSVMRSVVDELADEFCGQVVVGTVDARREPGLVDLYGIRFIPTLLFIRDGAVVDCVVGKVPKKLVAERLATLLWRCSTSSTGDPAPGDHDPNPDAQEAA